METWYDEICRVWTTEDVREIDFMPVLLPPYVLYAENTLGISMKVVKDLYLYAYQRFLSISHENGQLSDTGSLMQTSLVLLTIKADFPMAYNVRKTVLLNEDTLERYGQEIKTLHTLFSRHPKSPSAWQHVRWCYLQRQRLRQSLQKQIETIWPPGAILVPSEVETEREICRRSADRYPKNYYAWMHRLWLLPSMTMAQLEDEYSFTYEWLYMHTSDHSAMHHLIQIIDHVVQLEMKADANNETQEEFETIIQAKLVAQSESLESEMQKLVTAGTGTVGGGSSSNNSSYTQWLSIVMSALTANLILLVKRPESETLWLGQKMLLLLCCQALSRENEDQDILRRILLGDTNRIFCCIAWCQETGCHASFVSEKNTNLALKYQQFVQERLKSFFQQG